MKNNQFIGVDQHLVTLPRTLAVQRVNVMSWSVRGDEVILTALLPGKHVIDTAHSTFCAGISPQKEWIGRHVVFGLGMLHPECDGIRIDLVKNFHIRTTSRVWDGRAFRYMQDVPVTFVVTRARVSSKNGRVWCTAEWHLYQCRILASDKLLHGGCGYQLVGEV